MYFSVEIDSNLPTATSKEDVIGAIESLAIVLSEKEISVTEPNLGNIKDAYGNVIGVWMMVV